MNKNLPTIRLNSNISLTKSKRLLDITNKILSNKNIKVLSNKPFLSTGHTDKINSLIITSDDKYIISGSWDKTIKLWDIKSGECIKTFEGHTDNITSIAITPSGKYIVSGSEDETIKLWDIKKGKCVKEFEEHTGNITSVAVSIDGKCIVSGSWDKTIKLWDIKSGKCIKTLGVYDDDIFIKT